jgi:hypothetical protein
MVVVNHPTNCGPIRTMTPLENEERYRDEWTYMRSSDNSPFWQDEALLVVLWMLSAGCSLSCMDFTLVSTTTSPWWLESLLQKHFGTLQYSSLLGLLILYTTSSGRHSNG